jgi:hypothetical protein
VTLQGWIAALVAAFLYLCWSVAVATFAANKWCNEGIAQAEEEHGWHDEIGWGIGWFFYWLFLIPFWPTVFMYRWAKVLWEYSERQESTP